MSEDEAPLAASRAASATLPFQILAWICGLLGLVYVVLTIKAITEHDLDPLDTTPVALFLIMAAIVFAGGQWLPLAYGRFERAVVYFVAAVGCLIAIQLIPPAWQGPPIQCLAEKCQTTQIVLVSRADD